MSLVAEDEYYDVLIQDAQNGHDLQQHNEEGMEGKSKMKIKQCAIVMSTILI